MRVWVLILCLATEQWTAAAEPFRSVSGQFSAVAVGNAAGASSSPTVLSLPGVFIINPSGALSPGETMALDPALAVISCEQIKQSLLADLGLPDQWQGRINLVINPSVSPQQGTLLTRFPGPQGGNYRLDLPSPIKPRLLLRALVQAQLMEMANRSAGEQSAQIPAWLVAGLSARLQANSVQPLILQSQVTIIGTKVGDMGLGLLREQFRQRRPLTFQELSSPGPENLDGENYEFFSASSQLFLEQLLRLDDGRACLRDMLVRQLPQHLNWQAAFLEAYGRHFPQLLDVEKWWSLACVSFTGSDASARFSPQETWKELQEALDVPVEVRLSAGASPVPAEYTLQEIISDWDPVQAAPILQRAAGNLALLRMRAAPEFSPLLDRYLAAVQSYISDTLANRPAWTSNHQVTLLASVQYSVCKELTRLDRQRAELRPKNLAHASQLQKGNLGAPPSQPETVAVKNYLP